MPIDAAIAAVATLLTKVFGFVVDPDGLEKMKTEHKLEVIHAGIKIALDQNDCPAAEALFDKYRDLSRTV